MEKLLHIGTQSNLLYHHENRLGSSDYITDANGGIRAWSAYDEWGLPSYGTSYNMNTAGIISSASFTGYDWDNVLGVYFAQFRFYDPENKRFMSEDPIRSGRNWYAYCDNNPVMWVDPWGLEVVIISGGKYGSGTGYNYEFIDTALLEIKTLRETSTERILWLIADAGWTEEQKGYFTEAAARWSNVDVQMFSNTSSLTTLINNGTNNNRASDKITATYVFSHGVPGQISFGYHQEGESDLAFKVSNIRELDPNAFSTNSYFMLFSCRAGSTINNSENFAQNLANWTRKDVIATYSGALTPGKTDYSGILGLSYKSYLLIAAIEINPVKVAQAALLYVQTKEYEQERKIAVGGVTKPYPALLFPVPS